MEERGAYGLGKLSGAGTVAAPELEYLPPALRGTAPTIGLIGCGGISATHLAAYRIAGFEVPALCDRTFAKADALRAEHYPRAQVFTEAEQLLATDVAIVDIATHPTGRGALIEAALRAGKHVLSQKPFVLDLDEGERLIAIAKDLGLRLAVNQNGRWAPHFAYMRRAVAAGLIGDLESVDASVHWDHSWTAGTRFDDDPHLVLFDFGIHWFDMLTVLFADRAPLRVHASTACTRAQKNRQPMLAEACVEFEDARATLRFHGASVHHQHDTMTVTGERGTLVSSGDDLQHQTLSLHTAEGLARPALAGDWFTTGFHGTMAELMAAIEDGREPEHSAGRNRPSLALAYAACTSAIRGLAIDPRDVRRLP